VLVDSWFTIPAIKKIIKLVIIPTRQNANSNYNALVHMPGSDTISMIMANAMTIAAV